MPSLSGSVGKDGVNRKPDVETVQQLLKQRGVDPGKVDGACGPRTIAAIVQFQKGFMHHPDGLVEVNGLTWRKLSAANPAEPTTSVAVTSGIWSGDSAQWSQEKKLQSLNISFRTKAEQVLQTLRGRGFRPKIFYGWRSVAVQQELVKKGRSKVHFSFHNAQQPDGTPNAYAADVIDERWGWSADAESNGFWGALGEEAKKLGLVWGGDWTSFKDVAHIQGRQNSELAAAKRESGL
jgi:peptidoglycan L-alanyl-D-glutamate endopeptidase CwlK